MPGPDVKLIHRLLEAECPSEGDAWTRRDGYYASTCQLSQGDVPGLIDIARSWTIPDSELDAFDLDVDDLDVDSDRFLLLPVTAWRALRELKAEAAVEPLINILCVLDDEFDDWAQEELPYVFGAIGEATLEPLTQVAKDEAKPDFIRSIAVHGLRRLIQYYPDTRARIVPSLLKLMSEAASEKIQFNLTLLDVLVDLHVVEAAEPIERAFAGNLLDVGYLGDWETVRQKLGVEGLGLKMPENPPNSIEDFRKSMGIGIFSKRPLFDDGDVDTEARQAYHERSFDAFPQSTEGQQAIDRYGSIEWFGSLLEFGVTHLGESVDLMTCESVKEFVLDYLPRKASTDSTEAGAIIGELALFWRYLDRVYKLPDAKSVVDWLEAKNLVAQLEAELSDSSNFGMAKSLVMMGRNAGYDMTSEAGMASFIRAYNQSLPASNSTPPPTTSERIRVGRNESCPCGSGKKFKKCCSRLD
ncbi:MAG: DUF1186 domain-containing protein [Planctomycetota bacterium]